MFINQFILMFLYLKNLKKKLYTFNALTKKESLFITIVSFYESNYKNTVISG